MLIDPKLLVIRKPEKGMSLRKLASAANAIFFWGISIYLLLAAVGWFGGLFILDLAFDDFRSIVTLEKSGVLLLALAFIAYLLFWTWSAYNHFRFSGEKDRRRNTPASTVSVAAAGEYAGLPAAEIEKMRQAKIIVCRFDKNHKLQRVDDFSDGENAEARDGFPR